MSFDGIVTQALVAELKENLIGGKINKIYQHEKDEILLHIRNMGNNYRLLISSTSNNPRIYLTDFVKENPMTPPSFCMVLRKHLTGGRILSISQNGFDRVIHLDISSIDELGQDTVKKLIIEIMGKHSNIILVNNGDFKIIDSIKKVNYQISRIRQVLPGLTYENPPLQDKLNPSFYSRDDFDKLIANSNGNMQIYKFFYQNYQGLSPLISKEICFNSNIDISRPINSLSSEELDSLYVEFAESMDLVNQANFKPVYIEDELNNIIAFHALDLNQFDQISKHFNHSISKILDIVYYRKDKTDRVKQKSQGIRKSIQTKLERALNKLGKQKNELLVSLDREKYKIYADLISANLYRIPDRSQEIVLENFYDENMGEITVPLDKILTPVENAQRYYKRFAKLKKAEKVLEKQIPETEDEIFYLENVLVSIENSLEVEDLNEIIQELTDEGYIKSKRKKKKEKEKKTFAPHQYVSRDGFKIYVGKNNKQNEYLSLKFAHKEDIWLHVQNMPGSHVIIRSENKELPDTTIEDAAILAAYYSKARNGKNISVDYTERKNVRKIPNSKPGMVRYDNFSTILVSPLRENLLKINNNKR